MTSADKGEGGMKCNKFADELYIFFGQKGGGVKTSQNSVDVIYGSPLPHFPLAESER